MSSVSDFKEEIDELLSKMTLKEKVGQLNQRLYGWEIYKKTKTGYELTDTFKEEVKRWGELEQFMEYSEQILGQKLILKME
ncbi:hypothetical protein [Clostridium neonatale]|uniref:Uncharacterized protein n=1 Tax=Clostridium neonatale TaxID=137838 RepID=A0AA86MIU0_9CLOT|nr:hypothetical protein [Clostridium neonatale]MBP8314434.1 hypothetical protein [Clostridium neonatale]CAG9704740.1 hypothetical protein CNEO_41456 [Clostridium neonatale]CAI3535844.1 hypothetical protein CNEO4_1110003 [Clostridium neonatale]CAI3560596.1 hypothetical protein CNEO3_100064 [Clostridium neonatale]CAI3595573.1 hypothetical protein CNEO3_150052 [Clostridium neonatale]